MNKKLLTVFINLAAIVCLSYFISCSKENITALTQQAVDTCSTVTITDSIVAASSCVSDGAVFITATGSHELTFKIGVNGVYQSADSFTNIAAGTYTVYVKDSAGCVTTGTVVVSSKTETANATSIPVSSACGGVGDGSVTVTATGSSSFMYKLNSGGTYQSSNIFLNVAAGSYTVYAKDSAGCEITTPVTVGIPAPGPMFAAVKSLIAAQCQSCHNNSLAQDGYSWEDQCNIIQYQSLIQSEVNSDAMPYGGPPLNATQKAIINDWITAGGGYGN
jgi:hypothetical protein